VDVGESDVAVQAVIAIIAATASAMVIAKRAVGATTRSELRYRAMNCFMALTLHCRVRAIRRADYARDRFLSFGIYEQPGLSVAVRYHLIGPRAVRYQIALTASARCCERMAL